MEHLHDPAGSGQPLKRRAARRAGELLLRPTNRGERLFVRLEGRFGELFEQAGLPRAVLVPRLNYGINPGFDFLSIERASEDGASLRVSMVNASDWRFRGFRYQRTDYCFGLDGSRCVQETVLFGLDRRERPSYGETTRTVDFDIARARQLSQAAKGFRLARPGETEMMLGGEAAVLSILDSLKKASGAVGQ